MSKQEDRELLELAAKAAGYKVIGYAVTYHDYYWNGPDWGLEIEGHLGIWNPLEEDSDALKLIVELRMEVDHNQPGDKPLWVFVCTQYQRYYAFEYFDTEDQRLKALRRAIVRAAALLALNNKS